MNEDGRYEVPKEGGYPYIQSRAYRFWKIIRKEDPVEDVWKDFDQFYKDMGACERGHFPQRLDESKPWGPKNAVWIPREMRVEKMRERTFNPNSMAEKCRQHGINYHTFYMRMKVRGWSENDALSKPVMPYSKI